MHIYRIVFAKYSDKLSGSGRAARWNPTDINIIYTASSRALACIENAVHMDEVGLMQPFNVITINCPASIKVKTIRPTDIPAGWQDYDQIQFTQNIGERWVKENQSAILRVPSAIIEEEVNYLLNPNHEDFKLIRIIKAEPFIFDKRIKR
jgi:RES domain-containing protein